MAYRLGKSTVRNIVRETCEAIKNALSPKYLKVPSKEEWKNISKRFWEQWNVPNCLGAIDGKHIAIQAPSNAGSVWYNYKKFHSMVLMAVCDHNYMFTLFDIGSEGSHNDSSIFNQTWFGADLCNVTNSINKRFYFRMMDKTWTYHKSHKFYLVQMKQHLTIL